VPVRSARSVGYTYDSGTGKYKIALVDLLDDHSSHVT
jgi:hypothetical protein